MSNDFQNHVVLFGGAFNPPHLGHVDAVRGLAKNPAARKVIVLPTFGNPLKPETTSFENRFEMAKLNFPQVEVSRFEADQKTTSTFDLLTRVNLLASDQPVAFVIGTDQLASLDQWVNFPQFLSMCDWLVLLRKPKTLEQCGPILQSLETRGVLKPTRDPFSFEICASQNKPRTLRIVPTDAANISSTEIREKIALGKNEEVKKFLNPEVQEYIERNRLYGT
jgi:nicotinate-nucleotide adenylyltransferase